MERRSFLKLPLAISGAVLATQAMGIQSASAVSAFPLKGIGYADKIRKDPDSPLYTIDGWKRIQSLNPQWWYNWNQKRFDGVGDNTLSSKFVPMLWGDSDARLASLEADLASCNMPTRVLGFNEPDNEGQANMTTGAARRAWRNLEKAAAVENLKIGSPVTVSPDKDWMNTFMTDATELEDPDLKIDFVACHIYQNPDVGTFLGKIDALHDRWGKPVWVTETAVADWKATPGVGTAKSTKYTRAQVDQYITDLWPELQKRPWLERFAWKTRNVNDNQLWFSALFNDDGTLTSTGELYASL